jgi:hypothetical protein
VRAAAALTHVTPSYFPDEYLYPALARGLAHGDGPVIRGSVVHFPALLEPILTSPFWIPGDPLLALRLTQGLHALAMSLAAVPAYLLARRLGLKTSFALGCALFAVALPDLVYASFTLSDPIAYPLVLAALYFAVVALDEPTRRAQLAFAAFSGLAAFTRVQYAALPLVFAVGALVLDRRRAFSRYRLSLVLFGVPALAVLALGPGRVLGAYSGIATRGFHPLGILQWMANDAMVLVYAGGVVLVPGALVGLTLARTRVERAFAVVMVTFTLALLAQAGFIATFDSHRVQERYLFTLLPLLAPAFGLALRGGRRAVHATWVLALLFLTLSARVPLSGFSAAHGKDDSPALAAVHRLEQAATVGNGSLAVAVAAALLALAGGLAVSRRLGLPALGLAVAACAALSFGAHAYDARNSQQLRAHDMPADAQWVDHANLGRVTLVEPPGSVPPHALEALWWNDSIQRELVLGNGTPTDHFGGLDAGRVTSDGTLLSNGKPVTDSVLVQTYGSRLAFANASLAARGPAFELYRAAGPLRVTMLADGYYADGWLARRGAVTVWPDASGSTRGTLELVLSLPREAQTTTVRFGGRTFHVHPGKPEVVKLSVSGSGPQTVRWSSPDGGFASDNRPISAMTSSPEFHRTGGQVVACAPTV